MINLIPNKILKYYDFFIYGVSNIIILVTNLVIVKILNSRFGLEITGEVGIVFITMMLINSFIDFGFNITSTQKVIQAQSDNKTVSIVFFKTLKIKLILFFLSLIFIPFILFFYPNIEINSILIALTIPFSQSISLLWFCQAIKKITIYSYIVILTKLLYLATIFQLSSAFYFNFYFGLFNILLNIVAFLFLLYTKQISSNYLNTKINFKLEIKENLGVFSSNILIFLFLNCSFFIFSKIGNPIQIGVYSIAEKFLSSGRQFLAVYFNYSIPRMFQSFQEHGAKGIFFFRKQYLTLLIGLLILLSFILIFKTRISYIFLNEKNDNFEGLLILFSLILIAVSLNIPFFMYLLFSNKKKTYNFVLFLGLIILVILCIYSASNYQSIGIASSTLASEAIVSALLIYYANKNTNLINYLIREKK